MKSKNYKKIILAEFPVDIILNLVEKRHVYFGKFRIYMNSIKLCVFKEKNAICQFCKLRATIFKLCVFLPKDISIKEAIEMQNFKHAFFNIYGEPQRSTEREFTLDHIVARANKGTNDISNLQPTCAKCNNLKGAIDNMRFKKMIIGVTKNYELVLKK
ncbi:hypothetical protein CMI47_13065 [Candidatus Pacearchaeota archaeon]|nr:hypothetical protein [Candidatus Pacearchaeota archaeon]|tara:strand:+ start:24239 stop:24712 length:474 start_codon:yes stop_codon:yes gene_type:complete